LHQSITVHNIGWDADRAPIFIAALLAVIFAALGLWWPARLIDPEARAAIETAVAVCEILAAGLLLIEFKRSRRVGELALLSALATVAIAGLAFSALPALTGTTAIAFGTDARLVSSMLLPTAFAVLAFASGHTTIGKPSRRVALIGIAPLAVVTGAEIVDIMVGRVPHGSVGWSSVATAAYDPLTLAVTLISCATFVFAGVAFAHLARSAPARAGLLAGASFLLAAARFQYLAIPTVAADWVTVRELLRLAAYALLLAAAAREYVYVRRADGQAALTVERLRIARDLHDGLAQDLAVIAVHGHRLESELGSEHPLTVAARRALAASRGTILDLSASKAPNTEAALREVAAELEARFSVEITVQTEVDESRERLDLGPKAREQVVRIAREAIVNAVWHGAARHVEIMLDGRGARWVLRVSDDGCGIGELTPPSNKGGFGLPTMRARAEDLGGQLIARRRIAGGTELEVSLSAPQRN
jgi:signal transduction histidine kinase